MKAVLVALLVTLALVLVSLSAVFYLFMRFIALFRLAMFGLLLGGTQKDGYARQRNKKHKLE